MKQHICKVCGKRKAETEFFVVKGYRRKDCKRCAVDADTRYAKIRRGKYKQKAISFLGGKCVKCGYSRCSDALEFHHKDPDDKDSSISLLIHNNKWETIKKELKKCILVCANCHRELHAGVID